MPTSVGGIVGSTAFDGTAVYGPITIGGYLWSVGAQGALRWVTPVADGAHWGNPVATANGVVYSMDFGGDLDAFNAANGVPLLRRPVLLGGPRPSGAPISWGGVSIARNTVYAAVGTSELSDGRIVAFRTGGIANIAGPDVSLPKLPSPKVPTVIVAGPEAQVANYVTRIAAYVKGGVLTFYNFDVAEHDVQSTAQVAPDTPLFKTALIGFGQHATVVFNGPVTPGVRYSFVCSIHARMHGVLVVLP